MNLGLGIERGNKDKKWFYFPDVEGVVVRDMLWHPMKPKF